MRALLEVLVPPLRLVVYGAGNDAQPLVHLAASLDWHVTIVDGRPLLATTGRFLDATAVRVLPVGELAAQAPDPLAYHVRLSHNYAYDLAALQALAPVPVPYVGLLGPRLKAQRLLDELGMDAARRRRLHSPIGLDLGSERPEKIALCIVAEVQAHRNGRRGQLLREQAVIVREPVETSSAAACPANAG